MPGSLEKASKTRLAAQSMNGRADAFSAMVISRGRKAIAEEDLKF